MSAVLVTALDLACCCGGEEFVIVIPETDVAVATMAAAAATVHCGRRLKAEERKGARGALDHSPFGGLT